MERSRRFSVAIGGAFDISGNRCGALRGSFLVAYAVRTTFSPAPARSRATRRFRAIEIGSPASLCARLAWRDLNVSPGYIT